MEKIFLKNDLGLDKYPFKGLRNALKGSPEDVVQKIKESGLRGRGGAGFPAGIKWEYANSIDNEIKFVICNADEGEPGTFKDRFLMENLPEKVIEGIIICAYAVKSNYGYIYIRGEYEKAIKIIKNKIKDLYKSNVLGRNILGTEFNFDLKVIRGAGAYVCGDETSLINSIEGERGRSRIKPPLPIEKGLYGYPTIVNNVETLSAAAEIMKYDDNPYLKMGTEKSRGTKLVSISGDVNQPGVYEVELGKITIKNIIEDLAGGVSNGELGFVIPGGVATEALGPDEIDVPYTYENLMELNSGIGSGGMIVVSNKRNYFEIIKNVSNFFKNETCGTCFPCREANRNINALLNHNKLMSDLTSEQIEIITEIKETIGYASRCGFGQASVNFILSVLEKFNDGRVNS
jgi:NADH-quinone oxidoreductase subunit F